MDCCYELEALNREEKENHLSISAIYHCCQFADKESLESLAPRKLASTVGSAVVKVVSYLFSSSFAYLFLFLYYVFGVLHQDQWQSRILLKQSNLS